MVGISGKSLSITSWGWHDTPGLQLNETTNERVWLVSDRRGGGETRHYYVIFPGITAAEDALLALMEIGADDA